MKKLQKQLSGVEQQIAAEVDRHEARVAELDAVASGYRQKMTALVLALGPSESSEDRERKVMT